MKSSNKDIKSIIQSIQKKIDEKAKKSLNNVVDYATNQAQSMFDRFVDEVPADDPYVFVTSTPISGGKDVLSREISCVGNQVLFIEFGAGRTFYTGDLETRLYKGVMLGKDGNPIQSRPKSIYDIGGYGTGRGKDDIWFYKSQTGRTSENAYYIKDNSKGEPIMLTHGNRPARALYRAVGMAMRRLIGGKFK